MAIQNLSFLSYDIPLLYALLSRDFNILARQKEPFIGNHLFPCLISRTSLATFVPAYLILPICIDVRIQTLPMGIWTVATETALPVATETTVGALRTPAERLRLVGKVVIETVLPLLSRP